MRIPDQLTNAVIFVATKNANEKFTYLGSGFFVRFQSSAGNGFYAVTAKHLVHMFKERGLSFWICFNDKHGVFQSMELDVNKWHFHMDQGVDAAVYEFEWTDFDGIKMTFLNAEAMVDEESFIRNGVGIGNETIAMGLFSPVPGEEKTGLTPIGRCGIIASVPKHKLPHSGQHGLKGDHEVLLVEMRSIKGLSGSPVMCVLDAQHYSIMPPEVVRPDLGSSGGVIAMALGLISGHFKAIVEEEDPISKVFKDTEFGTVNTGIAYVTPMWKVREIIQYGRLAYRAIRRPPMPLDTPVPKKMKVTKKVSGTTSRRKKAI